VSDLLGTKYQGTRRTLSWVVGGVGRPHGTLFAEGRHAHDTPLSMRTKVRLTRQNGTRRRNDHKGKGKPVPLSTFSLPTSKGDRRPESHPGRSVDMSPSPTPHMVATGVAHIPSCRRPGHGNPADCGSRAEWRPVVSNFLPEDSPGGQDSTPRRHGRMEHGDVGAHAPWRQPGGRFLRSQVQSQFPDIDPRLTGTASP